MKIEARLFDDGVYWDRNVLRLLVRDGERFLYADGSWRATEPGTMLPPEAGIELPRSAIEAIAVAIQEWQGHTSHADTEARVLREWLAVERQRVDKALDQ